MKHLPKFLFLALTLTALVFGATGCATTDAETENVSSRPWNSPRGWEYGIPGMMPSYGL